MLLLRHASAGSRLPSPTLDRARRSTASAARTRERFSSRSPRTRSIASSRARTRAASRRSSRSPGSAALDVESRDELAPDGSRVDLLNLLAELPDSALVCTHREVFERLFGGEIQCEKGGTWAIEVREGRVVPVEYLPPASSAARERSRAKVS